MLSQSLRPCLEEQSQAHPSILDSCFHWLPDSHTINWRSMALPLRPYSLKLPETRHGEQLLPVPSRFRHVS